MQLSDVFLELGEERLGQLVREISIGKLRTYQLYDRFRTRTHLPKVNTELLRKSVPKFFKRLGEHDQEFATDLSQAILVAHMDMIIEVLNYLGIPNQEGFFEKDLEAKAFLTEGWQARTIEHFKGKYPDALFLFYINHLGCELGGAEKAYLPAA
jgi:hypothetical protein